MIRNYKMKDIILIDWKVAFLFSLKQTRSSLPSNVFFCSVSVFRCFLEAEWLMERSYQTLPLRERKLHIYNSCFKFVQMEGYIDFYASTCCMFVVF